MSLPTSPSPSPGDPSLARSERRRWQLLRELERRLEPVMIGLGLAWLILLVLELTRGLSPGLATTGQVIWIVFVVHFALELSLAPGKARYLARNWLTVVSLAVPALRVFRVFRAVRLFRLARVTRGVRLVRVVASINRGMRLLGATLRRRGFGYVLALTGLVTLLGAAAMYAFEPARTGAGGFESFGAALWWTAMMMTTMGTENWPVTTEGRLLCLFLAVYAFAVFGYVTAAIATFFIGSDEASREGEPAEMAALRQEIEALRRERPGPGPVEAPPVPSERR